MTRPADVTHPAEATLPAVGSPYPDEPETLGTRPTLAAVGCGVLGLIALAAAQFAGLPLLAPALFAAALVLPALVLWPEAALVVLVVVELASPRSFDGGNGVPGVYVLTLALACAAVVVAVVRGRLRPAWSPVLSAAVVLLCIQAIAAVAARDVETGFGVVQETAKNFVWFGVLLALLLASPTAPRVVARTAAATLAVLAGLTILQEFVLGNATTFGGLAAVPLAGDLGAATARHAGPQLDVNFWARVLVLGLPFALSFAQMAPTRRRWLLSVAAALAIFGGLVLTGSRGGLLSGFVAIGVWALLAGGRYARALWLAPLLLGLLAFVPGVGSRLFTLSMLTGGSSMGLSDPSLEGRIAAQSVALEMLVDHPVLGVGPGNFLAAEPEYLRRLSLDAPLLAPHNMYLEAAAESGLLGLAGWTIFLVTALVVVWRARLLVRNGPAVIGRVVPLPLVNGALAALAGWGVASIFLHLATFRSLLMVVALGAALDIWARRAVPLGPGDDWTAGEDRMPGSAALRAGRSVRRARRGTAVLVVLLLGGGAALWHLGGGFGPDRVWSAGASLQLVVNPADSDTFTAYDQDALTRTSVIRTFAGITADERFVREGAEEAGLSSVERQRLAVAVENTAPSGLITIIARGTDRADAEALAPGIRTAVAAYVNSLGQLYGLQPVPGPPLVSVTQPRLDRAWALVPIGLAAVVAAAGWWPRRRNGPDAS